MANISCHSKSGVLCASKPPPLIVERAIASGFVVVFLKKQETPLLKNDFFEKG
jgi:hypothetical protein